MLLDTHVLLWLREGADKLGRRSRRLIDQATRAQKLSFSAASLYELGTHVWKRRVTLDAPLALWRQRVLDFGINELAINGDVAVRASELLGLSGDPFDRLIAATADTFDLPLMTADAEILDWRGALKRFDARE